MITRIKILAMLIIATLPALSQKVDTVTVVLPGTTKTVNVPVFFRFAGLNLIVDSTVKYSYKISDTIVYIISKTDTIPRECPVCPPPIVCPICPVCPTCPDCPGGPPENGPGTPIENFGADPFYEKFYGTLTLHPSADSTIVTYTGGTSFFTDEYEGKECVMFNANLNPQTYPPNGVVNGNWWPGIVTARYSRVRRVLNPNTLVLDFPYNGGSYDMKDTKAASGYFFFDNKAAFTAAFMSADTSIKLQDGKDYVVKGGWNYTLAKNIKLYSPGKSGIKISMEDAFVCDATGWYWDYTNNSFASTFGSSSFFVLPINTSFNVVTENIDILPPHRTIPNAQYGRINTAFFAQAGNFASQDNYITGKRWIENCNNQREKMEYPGGTFNSFAIAQSNEGGKLNAGHTDLEGWQDFKFTGTWHATEPYGLRSQTRCGNIWRIGADTGMTDVTASNITSQTLYNDSITISNTGLVTMDSISSYQLATEYWSGTQSNQNEIYANDRRWMYIDAGGWRIYMANASQFADAFPAGTNYKQFTPLVNGSAFKIRQLIPVVGQTFTIDGTTNFKINDTTFHVENLGLQADSTYPQLAYAYGVSGSTAYGYKSPGGDVIQYNGVNYRIKKRKIGGRLGSMPGNETQKKVYWEITLTSPVTANNPVFTVVKSQTQFLLAGKHKATMRSYVMGNLSVAPYITNYLTYGTVDMNYDFRNCNITGYLHATDTQNVTGMGMNNPLYNLPIIKSFINAFISSSAISSGVGLDFRNRISGSSLKGVFENTNIMMPGEPQ